MLDTVKNVDIFLLDLIETGLDLATQRTIIDRLLEANPNVQLFITTHSSFVYDNKYDSCAIGIEALIH